MRAARRGSTLSESTRQGGHPFEPTYARRLRVSSAAHPPVDLREHRRSRRSASAATSRWKRPRSSAARVPLSGSAPAEGLIASPLRRTIYDAQRKTSLPGKLLRGEGAKPVADVAADEAYDGAGVDVRLLLEGLRPQLGRRPRPAARLLDPLRRQLHNALWNGKQMIYGDGDGKLFNRFTGSLDIIGHELTHGVTQHTAALVYQDQSGRAERTFLRRLRHPGQAVRAEADRGQVRLADRRRHLHEGRSRRRRPLDESPRHRLRRQAPRQGSAAGAHEELLRP